MNDATVPIDTVTVEIDRIFDASLERIWRMFTEPQDIAVWGCGDWYDHVDIDLDLRVGGVIHHRVVARSDGVPWTFHGVYLQIAPRERLVYTFDWKTDWREPPTPSTVVVGFSPIGDGRTAVHVEHGGVAGPGAGSTDEHWNHFLDKLESMVASTSPAHQ